MGQDAERNRIVERQGPGGPSGLQSRAIEEVRLTPLEAAAGRLGALSRCFATFIGAATFRSAWLGAAQVAASSSVVQRSTPLEGVSGLLRNMRLKVTQAWSRGLNRTFVHVLPLVTQRTMRESTDDMTGFEAGEQTIPTPQVPIADSTRQRLMLTLYAQILGHTPEEIVAFIEDGFPDSVTEGLDRDGERDELSAHVDLLLCVQQRPAPEA